MSKNRIRELLPAFGNQIQKSGECPKSCSLNQILHSADRHLQSDAVSDCRLLFADCRFGLFGQSPDCQLLKATSRIRLILLITLLLPAFLLAETSYVYPLMDARLSSKYGNRKHPIRKVTRHHGGVDLAAPSETPIRTMAEGRVVFADPYKGYGNLVVILHKDGMSSHYGHCKKIIAEPGKLVKAGEIIALVGSTGLATGPHLHLEIRENGKTLDPLKVFPGITAEAEG